MHIRKAYNRLIYNLVMINKIKEEIEIRMSLILARENASNLLDTCSRTLIKEWRKSDKGKGRKYTVKGNP
jgi:hypothetical protein